MPQICQETIRETRNSLSRLIFDYALIIFMVMGTLFYRPTPPGMNGNEAMMWGYSIQELFFRYGVFVLFAISMCLKPLRRLKIKSLPILFLYIVVIATFIGFTQIARRSVINIFTAILFYKMIVEYMDYRNLRRYAIWFFWLLFANLILCFLQWFDLDLIFQHIHRDIIPREEAVVGFMKLKANLGVFAALVLPLLAVLSPWLCLIGVPLLWYGQSSVAVMSVVLCLLFILYFRMRKRIFLGVVTLLIAGGLCYTILYDMPKGQFGERFVIWHRTLKDTLQVSPYFGFGIGSFAQYAPQQKQTVPGNKTWIWLHNEYLQVLFELGIVGFVIFIAFFKQRFREFGRHYGDKDAQVLFACMLSVMFISFFHFPFHVGKFAGLSVFLIALYHGKITELRDQNETDSITSDICSN